jgi:hypothetical protein
LKEASRHNKKNEAQELADNLSKQLHELNIQNTLLSERASGYLARLNDVLPKKAKSLANVGFQNYCQWRVNVINGFDTNSCHGLEGHP